MNQPPIKSPDLSLASLVSVALKNYGGSALVSIVFALAVVRMYADLSDRNQALVSLVRDQVQSSQSVASELRELIRLLETRKD